MGRGSRLLSEHFRVEFGDRPDMSRRRTEARVASYLLLPWRAIADLRRLAVLGRGADLVMMWGSRTVSWSRPPAAAAPFEVLCWNEGRFAFRSAPPPARSLQGSLPELLARVDAVP